ncbi:uncharacterized protein [Dermacentor albipictus]|uniref:uncharacterized protein isoform X2 n=1 Tax=Dermacentor albipictus TaxID=60249 RepID=UPI0038FC8581
MQVLCDVLVLLLTGIAWANRVADKKELLQEVFGNIMHDDFPLDEIYFGYRLEGEPNGSTLYRFKLTYGKIANIGRLLTPTFENKTCRLDHKDREVDAACQFNIKDAEVQYDGRMFFGEPERQAFRLYAWITEIPFGDNLNPASLTTIVYISRQAGRYAAPSAWISWTTACTRYHLFHARPQTSQLADSGETEFATWCCVCYDTTVVTSDRSIDTLTSQVDPSSPKYSLLVQS